MKMKYQRGGRAGKLHNMAMRIRKNKPERHNPLKDQMLKLQFMEQMKILAEQAKVQKLETEEATENKEEEKESEIEVKKGEPNE